MVQDFQIEYDQAIMAELQNQGYDYVYGPNITSIFGEEGGASFGYTYTGGTSK